MKAITKVTLILVVTMCSPVAAYGGSDLEPLVACMTQRASPQAKEAVASVIQEGLYCPPADLYPNENAKCPTDEKYRSLVKRTVFDLTRECSKEFSSRASLSDIEESFAGTLLKDDTVKAIIGKRRDAYEKSKDDFERSHPVDSKSPVGK